MESFKHSVLCLVPFVLLVAVAEASSDELTTFIIHVQPHENHENATVDERKTWYKSFLPEDGRLVHAYHHVATGFSARLTRRELDEVSPMPGFVTAIPDEIYKPLTTHTPEFLGLVSSQNDANSSAYVSDRGAGVIMGVLDTGVFPSHPSFSDAGMPPPPAKWKGRCEFDGAACNNKLIGARNFVFSMPDATGNSSSSDRPPFDDHGHGTHVASTAAGAPVQGANVLGQAAGVASGMAPRAHVAVYKVCNATACPSSDVLAGVEAAVADGCDVISISLGIPSRPFHRSAISIGTFGAIDKGVFVSMAGGNLGPNASSVSNDAPWILTVAASTMDRAIRATVRLGNGTSFDGESAYQPDDVSPSTFHPLVYAGWSPNPLAALCGAGSLDGFDVRGKIVICHPSAGRGRNITWTVKGEVVNNAGGAGMILPSGFQLGHLTLAYAHVLPASHVDYAASVAIGSYLVSAARPVAQIVFGGTVLGTSPAPVMAAFSSRGPSLQDPGILKPDVTGPGVNVLAAWPTQVGPPSATDLPGGPTFNIISGTSMSTPHLSGIAAAIKSKHPGWSPAAIKSAIMTTADAADRSGGPILDEQHKPADWFATGAGHVNLEKAADPGLVYDISPNDYIGYLCGLYAGASQNVSVIARRAIDCWNVTVIPDSSMLNYPSISVVFPTTWNRSRPVVVRRTAKNVGTVPSTYEVAVDMPAATGGVTVDVSPREIVFTEANQEQSFEVTIQPGQNGGKAVHGALRWVSGKYTVRSPISVSFA